MFPVKQLTMTDKYSLLSAAAAIVKRAAFINELKGLFIGFLVVSHALSFVHFVRYERRLSITSWTCARLASEYLQLMFNQTDS